MERDINITDKMTTGQGCVEYLNGDEEFKMFFD